MVRDALNRMAFSEDEEEAIEVDPYTDVDEGLPIMVTYRKNPNKKKGENFYEVAFPKKPKARALTDEEIEYFMSLKPLSEILGGYTLSDFERALEGLQNFDEEHEIGLFDDEEWLSHLEEIRNQYDSDSSADEEAEEEKPKTKKSTVKKKEEPEEEEEDEEESDDEEDETDDANGDELENMDRTELKKYIKDNNLDVTVKKSMTDDDLREAIRNASVEEPEEEEAEEEETDDDEEEAPKLTLADIRKKLGKK